MWGEFSAAPRWYVLETNTKSMNTPSSIALSLLLPQITLFPT